MFERFSRLYKSENFDPNFKKIQKEKPEKAFCGFKPSEYRLLSLLSSLKSQTSTQITEEEARLIEWGIDYAFGRMGLNYRCERFLKKRRDEKPSASAALLDPSIVEAFRDVGWRGRGLSSMNAITSKAYERALYIQTPHASRWKTHPAHKLTLAELALLIDYTKMLPVFDMLRKFLLNGNQLPDLRKHFKQSKRAASFLQLLESAFKESFPSHGAFYSFWNRSKRAIIRRENRPKSIGLFNWLRFFFYRVYEVFASFLTSLHHSDQFKTDKLTGKKFIVGTMSHGHRQEPLSAKELLGNDLYHVDIRYLIPKEKRALLDAKLPGWRDLLEEIYAQIHHDLHPENLRIKASMMTYTIRGLLGASPYQRRANDFQAIKKELVLARHSSKKYACSGWTACFTGIALDDLDRWLRDKTGIDMPFINNPFKHANFKAVSPDHILLMQLHAGARIREYHSEIVSAFVDRHPPARRFARKPYVGKTNTPLKTLLKQHYENLERDEELDCLERNRYRVPCAEPVLFSSAPSKAPTFSSASDDTCRQSPRPRQRVVI